MGKVGTIKNVSGCLNAKSASIYSEKGEYFIQIDGMFGTEAISLSNELASVSFERHTKMNKKGVAAKTLAGGLAGTAYGKGHTGLTGALYFLGHSIGDTSESTFIALTTKDGDSLYGEADARTASLLASIAPNDYDERDTAQIEAEQKKRKRFLKDAPRTYYEVKDSVDTLQSKLSELKAIKDNGKTFEEREEALEAYTALDNELSEKKRLLSDLELELKARSAGYSSHEDLHEKQIEVSQKGYKLQQKIDVPRIRLGLYVLSVLAIVQLFVTDNYEATFAFYHPIAIIYFLG